MGGDDLDGILMAANLHLDLESETQDVHILDELKRSDAI